MVLSIMRATIMCLTFMWDHPSETAISQVEELLQCTVMPTLDCPRCLCVAYRVAFQPPSNVFGQEVAWAASIIWHGGSHTWLYLLILCWRL